MPRDTDHPDYYRIFYGDAKPIIDGLPQGQAQSLLGAMTAYFLFELEPYKLPKQARTIFEMNRARLDGYRRSVLNGMKNRKNLDENPDKTETKSETEIETKNDVDNWFL